MIISREYKCSRCHSGEMSNLLYTSIHEKDSIFLISECDNMECDKAYIVCLKGNFEGNIENSTKEIVKDSFTRLYTQTKGS